MNLFPVHRPRPVAAQTDKGGGYSDRQRRFAARRRLRSGIRETGQKRWRLGCRLGVFSEPAGRPCVLSAGGQHELMSHVQ